MDRLEFARPEHRDSCAEHRLLRLTSPAAGDSEPEGLVDGLVEAVEQLERAAADGWRLVGVKLLRDARGAYHLDARLMAPRKQSSFPRAEIPTGVAKAA